MADIDGQCLLHKAILQGDEFSAIFLIKNGARTSAATQSEHVTPLHLAASYKWVHSLGSQWEENFWQSAWERREENFPSLSFACPLFSIPLPFWISAMQACEYS